MNIFVDTKKVTTTSEIKWYADNLSFELNYVFSGDRKKNYIRQIKKKGKKQRNHNGRSQARREKTTPQSRGAETKNEYETHAVLISLSFRVMFLINLVTAIVTQSHKPSHTHTHTDHRRRQYLNGCLALVFLQYCVRSRAQNNEIFVATKSRVAYRSIRPNI